MRWRPRGLLNQRNCGAAIMVKGANAALATRLIPSWRFERSPIGHDPTAFANPLRHFVPSGSSDRT